MDEFDDIRPYRDDEIPQHIELLLQDPTFIPTVCQFKFPAIYRLCPPLVAAITRSFIRRTIGEIQNQTDLHVVLARYVERIVETSTEGFSYSGIENLPENQAVLFVSNHRDITLDSILVNYALWLNKLPPVQIAVGENLFTHGFETEFMRLNGSFLVKRSAESSRQLYAALNKTSRYIRKTLEEDRSIWIAQREGRSKDGKDLTEPAILKMFMLAYRKERDSIAEWLDAINLIPVAITYELDPCAPMKAHELAVRETEGEYTKAEDEDFRSIARGLMGQKGHVHVGIGTRITGEYPNEQDLAIEIDRQIRELLQPYPTFKEATKMLAESSEANLPKYVKAEFEKQLQGLNDLERRNLLSQYANQYHMTDATTSAA